MMKNKEPLLRIQFEGYMDDFSVFISGKIIGHIGIHREMASVPEEQRLWVPYFKPLTTDDRLNSLEGMHPSFESFRGKAYRLLRGK